MIGTNGYTDTNPGGYSGALDANFGATEAGGKAAHTGAVDLQGHYQAKRRGSPIRERRIKAAAKLYADCYTGVEDSRMLREAMSPSNELFVKYLSEKYPNIYLDERSGRQMGLRETMSVTDYQALYVDVLDRIYYGYYNAWPIINKSLVRSHSLRDFRVVSRYLLDGMVSPLTVVNPASGDAAAPAAQRALSGPVPQDGATFPTKNTAPLQYQPQLYQAGAAINWRAFVNDDLGIFKDVAERLAMAGNRGISKFITSFYVDANGPNVNLYKAGFGNQVTIANGASQNNPPLTVEGIMDAINVLMSMKDAEGQPIQITGRLKLFYGPALHATASNIMNQLNVYVQNFGGNGNVQGFPNAFMNVTPWMIQNLDPVMDTYMPIVMSGAAGNIKNTTWGIMVDPASQNRPAIEVGFLNGFETPQTFTKVPNTMRMGGGVDPMLGDFNSMDQEMKIITVMGGTVIDGRSTVASNGSGT